MRITPPPPAGGGGGITPPAGDIGGTTAAPTVINTHLAAALPISQGGTGSETQNFMDLTTAQNVAGLKTFTGGINSNGNITVASNAAVQLATLLGEAVVPSILFVGNSGNAEQAVADLTNSGFRPFCVRVSSQAAAYQFALGDAGTVVQSTDASAVIFTIPANATAAFLVGAQIAVVQAGAGQVTIAAASGVALEVPSSYTATTRAQWSTIVLTQVATNQWVVSGDMG
jgi:hypothetical protein